MRTDYFSDAEVRRQSYTMVTPTATFSDGVWMYVYVNRSEWRQTLSLGCNIHNSTYVTLSLTLTIMLTLLTLTITVRVGLALTTVPTLVTLILGTIANMAH